MGYFFHQFQPHDFCKVGQCGCELKEGEKDNDDNQLVLPSNIQLLYIENFHLLTSLLNVAPFLKIAMELKTCFISQCKGIYRIFVVGRRLHCFSKCTVRVFMNCEV